MVSLALLSCCRSSRRWSCRVLLLFLRGCLRFRWLWRHTGLAGTGCHGVFSEQQAHPDWPSLASSFLYAGFLLEDWGW